MVAWCILMCFCAFFVCIWGGMGSGLVDSDRVSDELGMDVSFGMSGSIVRF